MVTAGEGASAHTGSTYGGGDGGRVGGKVTRNQFRRSRTTPYDRPSTARRNPSFLSKLVVDPIRNLASSAAHRFFASVTGKRLAPPPPSPSPPPLSPESSPQVGDGPREAVTEVAVTEAEAQEPLVVDCLSLSAADTGGISELEQLLKQKTFTRSEIERLTELLQSKIADLPAEVKKVEATLSEPAANFGKQQLRFMSPLAENGPDRERSLGVISTPGINTRVLEEDVASPAELAKAYMGSRPSTISPSMLGLRSQALREGAALLSNVPYVPKSPMTSLAPKTSSRVELAENILTTTTPRSRGRSAIYNMARTPYSRVHPTAIGKGSGSRRYGTDGYLLLGSTLHDDDGETGSTKMALKRRSSVLDDDLGSVGPIRRIRQKHNLSSQKLNLHGTRGIGGFPDAVQQPLSLTQKLPPMDEWKHKGLKMVGESEGNGAPSTSYAHVPPRSSEMAAKILQHLEKVTPKEKSAESRLAITRDKSPVKLTTDMLHGQALRSLDNVNSPKMLRSIQGSNRLDDSSQSSLARVNDFTFQKQERVKENGLEKSNSQGERSTPVVNINSTASVKDTVQSAEGSDSAAKLVAQRPQKKRAFMMSAHEESLDLDEDIYSNGPTSEALVGERGKSATSVTEHSSDSAQKIVQDTTPAQPEMKKRPLEPIFGKPADLEVHSATDVGGEKNGVAFPALQRSGTTFPSMTYAPSTLEFEKSKQENNKTPATESSSVPSVTGLSVPKPSSWVQPSTESSISSSVAASTLEVPASAKHNDIKASEAAEEKEKLETTYSSPLSLPSATKASSDVPANSNHKNGPLAVSPPAVLSTPALASTGFAHQAFAAGTSSFNPSTNVTNFATSTWSSATSNSSPFGSAGASVFHFGSSVSPLTAVSSSVSTTSDAELLVVKTNKEKEANPGSLNNTPFGSTSFAMGNTGSSIFGLSSSSASLTASSTAKSQSDSTTSGFVFGVQPSNAGSGASTVPQNPPFQFGSSASSPVSGSSGVSAFSSSSSLFSSSAPATKMFGSSGSSGVSPSTTSVETKSVDSGSGPSSGIFSFGAGASFASSGANALSSSSGASNTFSFGLSSSAASSLSNTVGSSSSTTPAIFGFGATSSLGTNMISSSAGTNTSIFGSSTLSPSSEASAASSSSAASVSFGSSWQTPNSSPFGATSSSSPSPVFSFAASSSSFAAANSSPMVFGSTNAAANTAPMVFGSSTAASSPVFSFSTASATTSLSPSPFSSVPMFGSNSTSTFNASGNNDQMSMEDSMAEDVQATTTPTQAAPVFGQQSVSPSPGGGFAFGSAVPQSASPFQFGGQQSQGALQSSSPFQASGSLEFNAGGSFSLGSGGGVGDKSNRRIVKVRNTTKNRKKWKGDPI